MHTGRARLITAGANDRNHADTHESAAVNERGAAHKQTPGQAFGAEKSSEQVS
jgi:hypothetical protein